MGGWVGGWVGGGGGGEGVVIIWGGIEREGETMMRVVRGGKGGS